MPATLALTTRSPLTCVVGVHSALSVRDLGDQLRVLAAEHRITGDHVELVFNDPLDAVLGWRHLSRTLTENVTLMSAFATPAAVEMLRDPSELARDAWARLTGGEATERGLFVVRLLNRLVHPNLEIALPEDFGLVLAVIGGPHPRITTVSQPAWIGRVANAPVRIDDANISKRHVELGVDSHEGWFARDAGSTGGFFIAGMHAGQRRHALHPGMVLELGNQTAVVILSINS